MEKHNLAHAYIGNESGAGQDDAETIKLSARRKKSEFWRVCWNIRPEFEQYLKDVSWRERKTVTEYVNELIAADMAAKTGN